MFFSELHPCYGSQRIAIFFFFIYDMLTFRRPNLHSKLTINNHNGEQGWRRDYCTRLLPTLPGFDLGLVSMSKVSWLLVLYSASRGFSLSSKINISKFEFDRMQDLPENHFRASGAFWRNIINYYYYYYYYYYYKLSTIYFLIESEGSRVRN